jgi:DnaJ-class molecular chaperone
MLGVGANADADEIKKAHRSLMQKYHPDKGGSDQLAARINQAKDILLGVNG